MLRPLPVTALLLTSVLLSGCSQSRNFTRRDYSEVRDPFMGGEDSVGQANSGRAGLASLDSGSSALAEGSEAVDPLGGRPSGPTPIRQVAGEIERGAPGSGVARAVYPATVADGEPAAGTSAVGVDTAIGSGQPAAGRSWQGPALSNFLSGRETESNATAGGASVLNRTTPQFPAAPIARRPSPAAEAAAMNEMNREIGGFSSFLEQSASEGVAAAAGASEAARESAAAAADTSRSFSEFASKKKAEWAAQGRAVQGGVQQSAEAARGAVRRSVEATEDAAVRASDDFFEELATPGSTSARANAPSSVPAAKKTDAPPVSEPEPGAVHADEDGSAEMVNPFETLDETFSGQPAEQSPEFDPNDAP